MPYDDPDATDPMTLHGVAVETTDDRAMHEMAECFVQEYLRSGFDPDRIMHMFKAQEYAGPYLAWRTLGEDAIRTMIDEQMRLRNLHRPVGRSDQRASCVGTDSSGGVSLPVLDS